MGINTLYDCLQGASYNKRNDIIITKGWRCTRISHKVYIRYDIYSNPWEAFVDYSA